ncbi:MAG: hypothetical protein GON13_00455 [Nanoarchaeota archaeon]|nr:hypothetical protein [Nanoarchaeota archaeon]
MPRKKIAKKGSAKKRVRKPEVIVINPMKKHVMTLYAFIIFTWVMLFSIFMESMGGFVINFKATIFGIILGIGATTLIFYNK